MGKIDGFPWQMEYVFEAKRCSCVDFSKTVQLGLACAPAMLANMWETNPWMESYDHWDQPPLPTGAISSPMDPRVQDLHHG